MIESCHARFAGVSLPSVRRLDRKSTRLNSSHSQISYAVFCLKKKILIRTFRPVRESLLPARQSVRLLVPLGVLINPVKRGADDRTDRDNSNGGQLYDAAEHR